MKQIIGSISAVFGLLLSLAANAQLTPGITLEARSLEGILPAALETTVYNGIAGPYAGFAVGSGNLGADDYASIAPPSAFNLSQLSFVGGVRFTGPASGVQPINRALQFNFFDAAQNPFSTFSVAFQQSGDFIWTITLSPTVSVPSTGFLQIVTLGTSTGRWFLTQTPPVVGSNSFNVLGFPPTHNHAFSLTSSVPEPGSGAILVGFLTAGAGAVIRRRRK